MKQKFVTIFIIAITSILFARPPGVEFRYPIDIECSTSKELVELGDVIEINVKAKINLDHENYDENYQYVLINQENEHAYNLIKWKTPPNEMKRNMISFKEKYLANYKWIIITSDDDTIINPNNEIMEYTFSVKISKIPNSEHIRYPIRFYKFNQTEDYGGFTNYINSNSEAKAQHDYDAYYLDLKVLNPNYTTFDKQTPFEVTRETPIDFKKVKSDYRTPFKGHKLIGDGYSSLRDTIYHKKSYPPHSSIMPRPVKSDVDYTSFVNLGNRYAKDKDNIYYQGVVIPEADLNSFAVISVDNEFPNLPDKTSKSSDPLNNSDMDLAPILSSNYFKNFVVLELEYYSKDNFNVYYGSSVILNADPGSFELLSLFFAKDINSVYFLGQPIEGSDPGSFKLIAGRLAEDKNHVYYSAEIISTNPEFFILMDDNYAKDDKTVWFFRNLTFSRFDTLNVDSPKEFKVIDFRYASDSDRVFFHGALIHDVDLKSYQVLGNNWSKDNKNIYYRSKLCEEVDYDTFEVTIDGAKDKNRIYDKNYRPRY
jgi:DKNYY family